MSKYPECFPEDFEDHILPAEARKDNKHVYRVVKNGMINRDSFLSTYEEINRGLKPMPKKGIDLTDPGTYSTSCHMAYSDATALLDIFMRHYPKVFIAEGETEASCGPCQLTSERSKKKDTHVDWWIYDDSKPQDFFMEVKEDEQ